jgi:hypothetical protein
MKGALPPSSKDSFFNELDDSLARCLPTAVDPVNEIFLILGCAHRMLPIAGESAVVRMLKTPLGIPAFSASYPSVHRS